MFWVKSVKPRPLRADKPRPPFAPRDRDEAALLRAIAEHDEPSRDIYADWLESKGHQAQAHFVRAQQKLLAISPNDEGRELFELLAKETGKSVDPRWRVRLTRSPIERCTFGDVPKFDFKCPKEWGGLELTPDQNVRHCSACKQNVYHCTNVPDARAHAERGECVALDLTADRWQHDLEAPYSSFECRWCRGDLGTYEGDECPRCHGTLRSMTVGRIA